ncbi:MAG: hypothetical protein KDA71_09980, partial [Planctomycetales bacterium]|nr:hypothetical protein [Planctomycetales bacterium]
MRWWLAALLVAGLVIVPGCGESKLEEMKRRAIRRSSDDEEEEPAPVAVAEAKPAEQATPASDESATVGPAGTDANPPTTNPAAKPNGSKPATPSSAQAAAATPPAQPIAELPAET